MEKTAAIKKPWDKAKVDIPQKSMRLLTLWVTRLYTYAGTEK
jgi:hypothetical protein